MEDVYLLLGSNRGDRQEQLKQAAALIGDEIGVVFSASGLYESKPWGFDDPVSFLNQVVGVRTTISPEPLMDILLSIEARLGRVRLSSGGGCSSIGCHVSADGKQYQGRSIDLDILFYGNRLVFTDRLMIPHPRLHERKFTLVPMEEVASELIHPLLKKSISTLLKECPDHSDVVKSA